MLTKSGSYLRKYTIYYFDFEVFILSPERFCTELFRELYFSFDFGAWLAFFLRKMRENDKKMLGLVLRWGWWLVLFMFAKSKVCGAYRGG